MILKIERGSTRLRCMVNAIVVTGNEEEEVSS